ncbi:MULTISPECIES: hypothetical protein [Marinobacter]|jgi:hypothetical protein|uniref:hypothetical protein n=1 Tax=Marinobacter TaxID=2742 RepID=UPI000948E3E7|nr:MULTISPECIES: hypothetical protein [Marinobacter]OLF85747.1 hypothetical protein AWH63_01920 [Marinobacter sp. C18]|tara:strand:- start:4457 stop:6328 length:1872 start_codon:yes stop_codon:yes gene_type:complete
MAWQFIPQLDCYVESGVTQRDQFRNDEVELSDTIVRESIQNSLDATLPGEVTHVRFSYIDGSRLESSFVEELFSGQLEHAEAAGRDVQAVDFSVPSALVIEDFGTKGLTGGTDVKDNDNFSDFWRRHGKSHKTGTSRGRWGLGKLVYSSSSMLGVFFGLTVRNGESERYLMGQTVLDLHTYEGKEYPAHAYFCDMEGEGEIFQKTPVPLRTTQFVDSFTNQFGISRQREPGLSIVIPFPFEGLRPDKMIGVAIENYFYPILTGQLVLEFGEVELTAHNIRELAHEHAEGKKLKDIDALFDFIEEVNACIGSDRFVSLRESWAEDTRLDEDDFDETELEAIRARFAQGDLVGVRLPLTIRKKPEKQKLHTQFFVFLKRPGDLEKGVDLYVRGGLTLPAESKFGDRKAFGAMIADDETISAFLGDAENPAHTKWIFNAEKLRTNYVAPEKQLKVIKNAVINFYDMLIQAEEEEDEKALAKFFFTEGATTPKKKDRKPDVNPPEPPENIPAPVPKVARIETTADGFAIRPAGGAAHADYPMTFIVTAAYDTVAGNPFKKYNKLDFDFAKRNNVKIEDKSDCVQVLEARDNRFEVEVTGPEFDVEITGFDPHRDLKVKLNAVVVEEE